MNELLDHYATLTELKMETGLSFDNASKWAWTELGSEKGLQKIQTNYERSTKNQLIIRHLWILKSYFRWPTIILTLACALLVYQLSELMTNQIASIAFVIILFTPGLALLYTFMGWGIEHTNRQKLAWRYLSRYANLPVAIICTLDLFSDNLWAEYLIAYPIFMAFFCISFLLVSASLIQLARENFHYKSA
ncbi:hypothetical protein GJR95_39870 [Spirosoma endbachense]|uniref:Uncharacterized protein n=2 Tax=Spirosoma endbachense TaxID=2666025 RepID=A0A6P1W657_9BACT|nr:hypothetical protein GJR95_39870 [Spirosoma endbachense]